MTAPLLQTPLCDWHVAHRARMVDFGGWLMPVQYTSITLEHLACRSSVTLFDVSHMGRLRFNGSDAEAFLDSLCTRRIAGTPVGKVRYSLICNDSGGILDDVLVYHLAADDTSSSSSYYWMVVNASNREKIIDWIEQHLCDDADVQFEDQTTRTAMIAVQGPQAIAVAQTLTGAALNEMGYYTGLHENFAMHPAMISRTGYTGEDGVEVTVAAEAASNVWNALMQAGADQAIAPAGLGARDTLRLEAAMPLYGHELSEEIGPIQAGLNFAVNLKDRQFTGRDAISKQKNDTALPVRVGLELSGRRVPREHYGVFHGNEQIGEVTSGTFSPTLENPIAMAYVNPQYATPATSLTIDIRGRREAAAVVELPFYKRTS
jgi:aminomethyltransferase